ncbi:TTC27 protein, partial [Polyodon spathula]|nr:TTC27 protein [Polyodon spathula]
MVRAVELAVLRGFLTERETTEWKQNVFTVAESGPLLQSLLDGSFEGILLNPVILDILTAESVAEEKIDSYLEKQILAYLNASTEDDKAESCPLLFILQAIHAVTTELQCRRTTQLWAAYRQARRHPASLQGLLVRDEDTLADLSPPLWVTLGQLCATSWELPSTVGSGIAWTQTGDFQAIGRILHSTQSAFYWSPKTRESYFLPCNGPPPLSLTLNQWSREMVLFLLGVACLQLFAQSNWTGPPVQIQPQDFLPATLFQQFAEPQAATAAILSSLVLDGESIYSLVSNPVLLLLARVILVNCSSKLESFQVGKKFSR